jgi:hypothetical protein
MCAAASTDTTLLAHTIGIPQREHSHEDLFHAYKETVAFVRQLTDDAVLDGGHCRRMGGSRRLACTRQICMTCGLESSWLAERERAEGARINTKRSSPCSDDGWGRCETNAGMACEPHLLNALRRWNPMAAVHLGRWDALGQQLPHRWWRTQVRAMVAKEMLDGRRRDLRQRGTG